MLFSSYTYLFFFLGVVLAYWALPARATRVFLLLASYVFYLSWGPVYGFLLGGATLFSWGVGLAIEGASESRRKRLMLLGVFTSLGVLAYFKYAKFLWEQVGTLWVWMVDPQKSWGTVEVVLPLGVSFFTFQMISYLVDVWRGAKAERNLLSYALYISFFPQLVAGPIVRASELLSQLESRPKADAEQIMEGVDLFVRGMFKKIVIADNLAILSDTVFKAPQMHDTWTTWVALVCYAGQIYNDFSGYTDMARGCAKMKGLEIPENFRLPYLSSSITEFWRRWHITLSSWLRDYLYISLGGNRHGKPRQYANLMWTMAFGGLWHGASWNFVIWGVYHGALLIVHKGWLRLTQGTWVERAREMWAWRVVMGVATFVAVCLGWVVFRAKGMKEATGVYANLLGVGDFTGVVKPEVVSMVEVALWFIGMSFLAHLAGASSVAHKVWVRVPMVLHGVVWMIALVVMYFLAAAPAEFIYFDF